MFKDTLVWWRLRSLPERMRYRVALSLPRWLVSQAFVRVVAEVTTGRYSDTVVPDLKVMEALSRFDALTLHEKEHGQLSWEECSRCEGDPSSSEE